MIKLSKKLILFCVLMLDLCKQLVVGLSVFLYNRTLGTRVGAFISIGAVALAFLFAIFVWAPSEMMAEEPGVKKPVKSVASKQKVKKVKENQLQDIENLLVNNLDNSESENDSEELSDLDLISFQATEYSASAVGRSEPFAPRNIGGTGMPGPIGTPVGPDATGLTAEEIAAQEAEKRRNEVRHTMSTDITVKGIVFDDDGKNPMAIVEYVAETGDIKVKTVVPGDVLPLSICEATVVEIAKNTIDVKSEDVVKRKHLPNFDDESEDADLASGDVSDVDPEEGDNLMPPPVPSGNSANKKDSSMSDAKKKIEEIDKLLDSF